MKRCVPYLIREGKKQDQSVAICISMWKRRNKAEILKAIHSIKDDILEIKSKIVEKVYTPPLNNIHDVELPKKKKKNWYE